MPKVSEYRKKLFAKAFIEYEGNASEAYKKVFKKADPKYATTYAHSFLRNNPDVKDDVAKQAQMIGLDTVYLNSRLKELCEAEKSIVVDGNIVKIEDNSTSLEAVKQGYKLHNIGNDGVHIDNRTQSITISTPEQVAELKGVLGELKALHSTAHDDDDICDGEIIDA